MFRATLFSIVLTLAVGQNAGLLCAAWCYQHDAASVGCSHEAPTTPASVRADDDCNNVVIGSAAFVREDGRRTAPARDVQHAVEAHGFRIVPLPTDSRAGYESGRLLLFEERPLVIALRI